jgi:hypothetical protein
MNLNKQHFDAIKNAVDSNNGVTVGSFERDGIKPFNKQRGYIVSDSQYNEQLTVLTFDALKNYFDSFNMHYELTGLTLIDWIAFTNLYFGVWYYQGVYHLDCNKHFDSLTDAVRYGIEHKQTAIYDCERNESVLISDINIMELLSNGRD